jgi:hypothetical protein
VCVLWKELRSWQSIDQFCVLYVRMMVVGGNRQFTEDVDYCWCVSRLLFSVV